MNQPVVTILPEAVRINVSEQKNLLDIINEEGFVLESPCGGLGLCGKCLVKIEGKVSGPTQKELEFLGSQQIHDGYRLACQVEVEGDINIEFPLREEEIESNVQTKDIVRFPEPDIQKIFVEIKDPSLQYNLADIERVKIALGNYLYDDWANLDLLVSLADKLRNSKHKITAIIDNGRLVGIEEGNTTEANFGIVVDLGTTTIVFALININTGQQVAYSKTNNPNLTHGFDVVSRASYTQKQKSGLEHLRNEILNTINGQISLLCTKGHVPRDQIYKIAIAGNPINIHILLGLNVVNITKSPYVSVIKDGLKINSSLLGIISNPVTGLYLPPLVSAYIGSDVLAGVIYAGLQKKQKPSLLMDLGTNGEMVLWDTKNFYACSTAAGPAFEGMNIYCGVRAVPGAIVNFEINSEIKTKTIGGKEPIGICGSGLVNLTASLLKKNYIDKTGRLELDKIREITKVIESDEVRIVLVDKDKTRNGQQIYLSQKDIRQIQLAKGAIRTGFNILLEVAGIEANEIETIFIAGDFGKHLDLDELKVIGIFPEELQADLKILGNSSLKGLRNIMLDRKNKKTMLEIACQIKTIQLSTFPDFQKNFIGQLNFP